MYVKLRSPDARTNVDKEQREHRINSLISTHIKYEYYMAQDSYGARKRDLLYFSFA